MDEGPAAGELAVPIRKKLAAREQHPFVFVERLKIDPQHAGRVPRLVPSRRLAGAVGFVIGRYLLERQCLVPLAVVLFVHCGYEVFAGLDVARECKRRGKDHH